MVIPDTKPEAIEQPLVSVIIPTYQRAELLRRSIHSVLAQTYRNIEVIVVDDCSPDHTTEIVGKFSDSRLHYLRLLKNGRAAAARNAGLARARGSLIAFQDDDDIWLPHKLERQVQTLQALPSSVGLLLCSYLRLYPTRIRYIGHNYHFKRLNYANGNPMYIDYGLIATPGWLVRRSALDKAGHFDTRMLSWDDWELGLRLWKSCEFWHLDEPLFIQDHVHGSAMMHNEAAFSRDMRVILEKHGELWEQKPLLQSKHYYVVGRGLCQFESVESGRPWLIKCLKRNPFHIWAWITLLVSACGQGGVERSVRMSRAVLGWPRFMLKRVHQILTGQG